MRKAFLLIFVTLLLASCSEYQQVLKADDMAAKYSMADSLYKEGKYKKSLKLWDQIVPNYRGKPQAERIIFLYADTYYNVGDFYMAGYQFDRFVSAYPNSEKAEEAQFKAGLSYYELSPRYSLDQSDTEKALDKLQTFIGKYPESAYTEQASEKINELSLKMQKKAFEIAKQYYTIGSYLGGYISAKSALDDFISDYPGSPYREGAFYYKLDSQYKYAVDSVESLVQERLEEAVTYYNTLIKYYPEGEYREKADIIKAEIDQLLQQYNI
ncbi:MAG: outer membrane protein assembly factor BamD [Leeuwenhoekiella sp.]